MENLSPGSGYPQTSAEDHSLWETLRRNIDPHAQLPDWPFVSDEGWVTFCQWDDVISGDFGSVFKALCEHHGDDYVVVATFQLGGKRRVLDGRLLPVLRLQATDLNADFYWEAIQADAGSLYGYPLSPGAEVLAATGNSGRWSLWAQVNWEVGVVTSVLPPGPWLDACDDLTFVDLEFAMSSYMRQALGDRELSEATRVSFESAFGRPGSMYDESGSQGGDSVSTARPDPLGP